MRRKPIQTPVNLLRDLIAIPSINPAFAQGHDAWAGEARVAAFILKTARSSGLDASLEPVLPGRSNVIVRLDPTGIPKHRLLLAPHLDTVGAARISEKLFKPILRDGRLHGRGACDTKGSIAAMLTALFRCAHSPHRPRHTEIAFTGLIDEENGQLGSRTLARSWKADLAIVGEPTQERVITAHKGDLWLELTATGRPAHGSMPHLGKNAIHTMARAVHLLETDYAGSLRARTHPLLGNPTINVGSIAGGTQPNVVPAQCAIRIDRRMLPGETEKSVRQEIATFLRHHKLQASMSNARSVSCPALETNPDHPWIRALSRLAGQKRPAGVHYFCDAAVLAAGGIPSIAFGPGDIAQAHTEDEWIQVKSLDRAADLLTKFLESLP